VAEPTRSASPESDGSFDPGRYAANRATILVSLGIGSSTTPWRRGPNPKSLCDFLVHQFNRIEMTGTWDMPLGIANKLGASTRVDLGLLHIGWLTSNLSMFALRGLLDHRQLGFRLVDRS
jgi:hypothetical protein